MVQPYFCLYAENNMLGILSEQRNGMYGEYTVTVYNREAQQFIIDNIETVINYANDKKKAAVGNKGQTWTQEQKECLVDFFSKNMRFRK